MRLVFLTLETACERLEGLRQGGELTKDSEHATLGSLVVQESEEPREAVSSGLAGSPAYMFWSSALHFPLYTLLGAHSTLPGCADLAEGSTQRAVLGGKAKGTFSGF